MLEAPYTRRGTAGGREVMSKMADNVAIIIFFSLPPPPTPHHSPPTHVLGGRGGDETPGAAAGPPAAARRVSEDVSFCPAATNSSISFNLRFLSLPPPPILLQLFLLSSFSCSCFFLCAHRWLLSSFFLCPRHKKPAVSFSRELLRPLHDKRKKK